MCSLFGINLKYTTSYSRTVTVLHGETFSLINVKVIFFFECEAIQFKFKEH